MAKLTRSIVIDAPVGTVFEFALDPRNLWTFEDVALTDVAITPDGVGTTARMFTHFLGFHMEGGVEYTEVVLGQRIVAKVHFFGEKPTWTFTFEPTDGGTKMTAEGEWNVNVPVVGKPYEKMAVKEHEPYVGQLLEKVKAAIEAKSAA